MLLIKFFTNDKTVFFINLIILIMISENVQISDMNSSSLIFFFRNRITILSRISLHDHGIFDAHSSINNQ